MTEYQINEFARDLAVVFVKHNVEAVLSYATGCAEFKIGGKRLTFLKAGKTFDGGAKVYLRVDGEGYLHTTETVEGDHA